MALLREVDIKLKEASTPGVEPSEVENKITNLEVYLFNFLQLITIRIIMT